MAVNYLRKLWTLRSSTRHALLVLVIRDFVQVLKYDINQGFLSHHPTIEQSSSLLALHAFYRGCPARCAYLHLRLAREKRI